MKNIALAGNPNSGKSTLFNALTGATQFVGNWPGVTVEKKTGKTTIGKESVNIIDLPGIYSLSPYSNEEIVSRDYILKEKPELIINIVDASNLERNLYLTTQIIELGVPVVVALNMIDVVQKKGEEISSKALAEQLGCPVCEISAVSGKGIKEMKDVIAKEITKGLKAPNHKFTYPSDIEKALGEVKSAYTEKTGKTITDFISLKIVTNEKAAFADLQIPKEVSDAAASVKTSVEKTYDDDFDSVIAEQRYTWIKSIINTVIVKRRKEKLSISDKIDLVLTNKWLALPIFFAIIYFIYWMCLNPNGLGKKLVGITFGWVFKFLGWAQTTLDGFGVSEWLVSLICDGCIFGVGIVIAFVPYLMLLFFFLALLEECGYMARVTFIMDRVFRRFGLSGKSFIPMLLGTGCTVQAVAAARTIENENDRKMTIYLTPFIPCATMMPTIILIATLLSPNGGAWIAPLVYLIAIIFVILGGIFLKNTFMKGDPAPFVMELPEYKIPRPKNVWHFIWGRTVSFFKKAASIIFVTTVIIWFLKYFNFSMQHVDVKDSMLGTIGHVLAPIFAPLGFGKWELVAAMITGYVAKDNVLATLGVILGKKAIDVTILGGMLTNAGAVGFLMFFILSSPCFASMGAMRKELGSAKETAKAIAFQMGSAYIVALIAYQILRFIL